MVNPILIFASVFIAELGDKTQIATATASADPSNNALYVFLASALALVLSSALATLLGSYMGDYLNQLPLAKISGIIFIILGIFNLLK